MSQLPDDITELLIHIFSGQSSVHSPDQIREHAQEYLKALLQEIASGSHRLSSVSINMSSIRVERLMIQAERYRKNREAVAQIQWISDGFSK